MKQDEIFAAFEGDRWFARNKTSLQQYAPEADVSLQLLALYQLHPQRVLEIGAANGFRVATIVARYGARGVAVDPSTAALAEGRVRFPDVEFRQGESHAIPLQDTFDLIVVNFVLHWVDRTRLLQSIAEIDRLLADGGFLIIGDFSPANRTKVPYHHLPEHTVYTYKQNYAAPFLASGLYHSVGFLTASHTAAALHGDVSDQERISVWLLKKTLTENYYEGTTSHVPRVRSRTT